MKKITILLAIVSSSFLGFSQKSIVRDSAKFNFETEEYNFGKIKQGEIVTYEFVFKNTGKQPLIITEAHGSCGCTVPDYPLQPIMKGKEGRIKVTFNSNGKSGLQDKTVTITSNAKGGQKVLHMKGEVLPIDSDYFEKK